jgi:hypothetical protein
MKKTNLTISAAALLVAALTGQGSIAHAQDWRKDAEGREVDCSLKVKGKTYLKGTCMYDADKDGSFRLFGDKYFVYLNMLEKGVAGASWNGKSQASHAQEPLGEDFKLKGGCWVGKSAEICALDKKQAAKPAASKAERIKFARGAVSATVTGKLADFDGEKNYVIGVGKGQTMTVEQVKAGSKPVTLGITAPNGEDASDMDLSCNGSKKVSPTMAGDYTINVHECTKADPWKGSYALKVTVK